MVMYCRKCGKVIAGTKGHASGKAIAGGLLLGPVGAVVGAAHGLAKEGHGEGLCVSCRRYEAEMRLVEAKDRRMKAEMRLIEAGDEAETGALETVLEAVEAGDDAELRLLKAKYPKLWIWKHLVDKGFVDE